MNTRMPNFGQANVGHLAEAFAALDPADKVARPALTESPVKVKAAARQMVGAFGFGCIKCHTFSGHKAEGVQGIDMTLLTKRLQPEWFTRYLLDPQKIRPGTRMPSAWPMGQTTLPTILDGDAGKQIEAIWTYLADGTGAVLPLGMSKHFIPLIPDKEAIIYRNFVEGAGSRAIAVGYPEKAHLAFDANDLRLALLWQGAFMDASRHWTDRGAGYQPPLGDNVLRLSAGVSFAVLAKDTDPWPTTPARELGYRFRGYRLTPDQRPTFLYTFHDVRIEDFPNAFVEKDRSFIRRKLTLTAPQPPAGLWFRAAVAAKIDAASDGWFSINGQWRLRIQADAAPIIRQAGGQKELLVPIRFDKNRASIVQEFAW
jgi:hypothetical protein